MTIPVAGPVTAQAAALPAPGHTATTTTLLQPPTMHSQLFL